MRFWNAPLYQEFLFWPAPTGWRVNEDWSENQVPVEMNLDMFIDGYLI